MASNEVSQIQEWGNNGYADFNAVCVAKNEGTAAVDIDDLAACKAVGMPAVPQTFTVKSPKGYHLHFAQSDALRVLGNRDVVVNGMKILELKVHNRAVAAPGCVRGDGKEYSIHRDLPLIEMPVDWISWISQHSNTRKNHGTLLKVHPDFNAEELFRHYEWEWAGEFEKDGAIYHVFAKCPLAGRTHEDQVRSKKTCLIIGRTIGFDCKSCGEEHTYRDLIKKMLDDEYEKFPGYVFEDEDDAILLKDIEDCEPFGQVLGAEEAAALLGAKVSEVLPAYPTDGLSQQMYLFDGNQVTERRSVGDGNHAANLLPRPA